MFHAVHRSDPNISLAMDRLLNNTELFKQKKKKKKKTHRYVSIKNVSLLLVLFFYHYHLFNVFSSTHSHTGRSP